MVPGRRRYSCDGYENMECWIFYQIMGFTAGTSWLFWLHNYALLTCGGHIGTPVGSLIPSPSRCFAERTIRLSSFNLPRRILRGAGVAGVRRRSCGSCDVCDTYKLYILYPDEAELYPEGSSCDFRLVESGALPT